MPYKVVAVPPDSSTGSGLPSTARLQAIGRSEKSLSVNDMATIYAQTPSSLDDRSLEPNRIAASNRFSPPSPVANKLNQPRHVESGVISKIQNRSSSGTMAVGARTAVPTKMHTRSNLHVEGTDWWQKKGALFVFAGGQVSPDERPALTLYFQRFPTEYSYTLEQRIADQDIPGQTGTNFQKLGSSSAKFQVKLKFHDAWLAREQVSTAQGLKSLNSIISEGWRYKIMWTIGGGTPVPIVIKGIKVTMSNFIHAGHTMFVEDSPAGSRHVHTIARPGYLVKNRVDDPQVADVDMEFCLDLSKDVVVPFIKRTPPKRVPPPPSSGRSSGGGAGSRPPRPNDFEAPGGAPQVDAHLNGDMLGSLSIAAQEGNVVRMEELARQARMSDRQRQEWGLSVLGDKSPAIVQPAGGELELINFPKPQPGGALLIRGLPPMDTDSPPPRIEFAEPGSQHLRKK